MWRIAKGLVVAVLVVSGLVLGCGERAGNREFDNGVRHFERDRPIRARDSFERSINARPGHPANAKAYQYLGVIAWQLDDPEGAVAFFERSRELDPRLFEPLFNLGVLAFEAGDWSRARQLFRTAAQRRPELARPLEYLAETYWAEGAWKDAQRALEAAHERAPRSPRILTALGVLAWQAADTDQALDYWMLALEAKPNYAPALYNLGAAHAAEDSRRDDAVAFFEHYTTIAPAGPQRERALGLLDQLATATVHVEVAQRRPLARPPTSDTGHEETDAPTPPTWRERLARTRQLADEGQTGAAVAQSLRLAAEARRSERLDRVEAALKQALEYDPQAPAVLLELGRLRAQLGDHAAAIPLFQQALETEPDWVQTWAELADSAWQAENLDVALNAQRRAVALAPDQPEWQWLLATRYAEAGVRGRAAEAFQRFSERFPADARATEARRQARLLQPRTPPTPAPEPPPAPVAAQPTRNINAGREAFQRGMAYQRRHDLANALAFYLRAVQHDPELEAAHYNAGLIHLERHDFIAALDAFRRAVALRSDNVNAMYNLALSKYELDRHLEAIPHLESVLHIDPVFAPAHLLLGTIYARTPQARPDARRHYRRYLELRPDDANAPAIRAWLERHP